MTLLVFRLLLYENIFADPNLLILCPQNDTEELLLSHKELYFFKTKAKNLCTGLAENNLNSLLFFFYIQCIICVPLCPDNGCLRRMQVWNLLMTYYVVFPCRNVKRICYKQSHDYFLIPFFQ